LLLVYSPHPSNITKFVDYEVQSRHADLTRVILLHIKILCISSSFRNYNTHYCTESLYTVTRLSFIMNSDVLLIWLNCSVTWKWRPSEDGIA
jgi:hypothetical protein